MWGGRQGLEFPGVLALDLLGPAHLVLETAWCRDLNVEVWMDVQILLMCWYKNILYILFQCHCRNKYSNGVKMTFKNIRAQFIKKLPNSHFPKFGKGLQYHTHYQVIEFSVLNKNNSLYQCYKEIKLTENLGIGISVSDEGCFFFFDIYNRNSTIW